MATALIMYNLQYQVPETEAAKWSSAIIHFII